MKTDARVIRIHLSDNVVRRSGLAKGVAIDGNMVTSMAIPPGHKVALEDLAECDRVICYGEVIGMALAAIACSGHVNETNIRLPNASAFGELSLAHKAHASEPLKGYTFEGFRNHDGSVDTKNVLDITICVQCVAGTVDYAVQRIKRDLSPRFPNVDDVVGTNNSYRCGMAINRPAVVVPICTRKNIALPLSFGNEVMVVGLGCETL